VAILPSATPVGDAAVTVTLGGQTSPPAPVRVVRGAFGFTTVDGSGGGVVAALDADSNPVTFTATAKPGQTVRLSGTGLGPVSGDETKTLPGPVPLPDLPVEVFIGNKTAEIVFRGRAGGPGRDRLDVVIPEGVAGCYTSVWARIGDFVSNFATISVAPDGGVCSGQGFSLSDTEALLNKEGVSAGWLSVGKFLSTAPPPIGTSVTDSANASFVRYDTFDYTNYGGRSDPAFGSCIVTQALGTAVTAVPSIRYLDAGTSIGMRVQGGAEVRLTKQSPIPTYVYSSAPPIRPGFLPDSGGTFEFNGPGGMDVGPFTAPINAAARFTWTNRGAIANVSRTQGLEITWTGGQPDTYMIIYGASSNGAVPPLITAFNCSERTEAGRFTIPRDVLAAMVPSVAIPGSPVPTGQLALINYTHPARYSAEGLDVGTINFYVWDGSLVRYQ